MDFYNHRFDFLRFVDKNIDFTGDTDWENPEEIEENYKECKDFILPYRKYKLENGKEIGEGNIVTGSTCFFVNTGDLFIARRFRVEGDDSDTITWFKVGEEISGDDLYTEYVDGDNPYYESSSGGGDVG